MKRILVVAAFLLALGAAPVPASGKGSLTVIMKYDEVPLEGVIIEVSREISATEGETAAHVFAEATNTRGEASFFGLESGRYLVNAASCDFTVDPFYATIPMWNEVSLSWDYSLTAYPKTEPKATPTLTPIPTTTPMSMDPEYPIAGFPTFTPTPDNPEDSSLPPSPTDIMEPTEPLEPPDLTKPGDLPKDGYGEYTGNIFDTVNKAESLIHYPNIPPIELTRLVLQGDGSYIEFDDDGAPLGRWRFDEDSGVWVFDEFVPLNVFDLDMALPQTGMLRWPVPVMSSTGLLLLGIGIWKAHEKNSGFAYITAGTLLLVTAVGFHAYNLFDENNAADSSAQTLRLLSAQIQKNNASDATSNDTVWRNRENEPISFAEVGGEYYIGILSIPRLSLDLPVSSKWSYPQLKLTPCRYSGEIESDNLVIIAHNYKTHFGKAGDLKIGDEVRFTDTSDNTHLFKTASIETVGPSQVEEVVRSEYPLTFFTCNYGGDARVVVRCVRV